MRKKILKLPPPVHVHSSLLQYICGVAKNNSLYKFNPKIKLQFEDIQIIGTALKDNFNEGVAMKNMNNRNSLWKIKLQLENGEIKFRNGNDWSQNWGGDHFPNGKAIWFGNNIYVEKGIMK